MPAKAVKEQDFSWDIEKMQARWEKDFPQYRCVELPFDTPINGGLPALIGKYRTMGYSPIPIEGEAKVFYLHHPDNVLMGMDIDKYRAKEAARIQELKDYQRSEASTGGITKLPDIEV